VIEGGQRESDGVHARSRPSGETGRLLAVT
jgi:hypothetical protein